VKEGIPTSNSFPDRSWRWRMRRCSPAGEIVAVVGEGTEFESLRVTCANDDYRTIDWKENGTPEPAHNNGKYETERNQRVVLAIDTGRLMGAKVGDFTKLDYAVNATALLAQIALLKGDLVGLLSLPIV